MKKIISIITLTVLLGACTERFDKLNMNPYSISDESLAQDFNFGSRFATLLRNITPQGDRYQYSIDWGADNFVRHTGTPLDEYGGRDMMSYFFIDTWNNVMWNHYYNNVMSPSLVVKELAVSQELPLFEAWANLFQVIAVSRLTTYYGPVIYSEYGKEQKAFTYDSEKELYNQLFAKLDTIHTVFKTFSEYTDGRQEQMQKFDASYNGDLTKWLKFINSMKLRLAMRIVKADPALAQEKFQEALKNPIILTNDDNFFHSLYGGVHPGWQMSNSWGDCRMGSGMEEVLVGYKDPRIKVYFQEATDSELTADHPNWNYKGIAGGAYLVSKPPRVPFSALGTIFETIGKRSVLDAAEVNFLLAEAALRGWAVPKSAKEYYEDGIKLSWQQWGATGDINAYLADDVSKPIDYVDPVDARNNYKTRMSITIKWNDGADPEENLERIMVQKWIASFQNSIETWSDFRRTDYPKLSYVAHNESNTQWGLIPDGEFIKRVPFVELERQNNPEGVRAATEKLGGENKISTRLWIHPAGPNF